MARVDLFPSLAILVRVTDLSGQPAVPFDLPDADGARRALDDYVGHWLLLVFHRHLG